MSLSTCASCGRPATEHCSACSTVAYCSKDCQRRDWRSHKPRCREAVAARRQARAERLQSTPPPAPAWPAAPNSLLPIPHRLLFPYDRFVEAWVAAPSRGQPAGLRNLGNTCYANALLQSLLAIRPLAGFLLSGRHSAACPRRASFQWCPACEMEKLAKQAYAPAAGDTPRPLAPYALLGNVHSLGGQLRRQRQEDSHELYVELLAAMEGALLQEAGQLPAGHSEHSSGINGEASSGNSSGGASSGMLDQHSRETTALHHTFLSYLRTEVCCRRCGRRSRSYQADTALVLEVPSQPGPTSLQALLQAETAQEKLEGECAYRCDACAALVPAVRQMLLEIAPNALTVVLKRWSTLGRGSRKILTHVSFPEQLDMGRWVAGDALDRRWSGSEGGAVAYRLRAVVVHKDHNRSTGSGHYVAYVRTGQRWFLCDDDSVEAVPLSQVLQASAYLLFYERQQPRGMPLSGSAVMGKGISQPEPAFKGTRGAGEAVDTRMGHPLPWERRQRGMGSDISDETGGGSSFESREALRELAPVAVLDGCSVYDLTSTRLSADDVRSAGSSESGSTGSSRGDWKSLDSDPATRFQSPMDASPDVQEGMGVEHAAAAAESRPSAGRAPTYAMAQQCEGGRRVLHFSAHLPVNSSNSGYRLEVCGDDQQELHVVSDLHLLCLPLPLRVQVPALCTTWSEAGQRLVAQFAVAEQWR